MSEKKELIVTIRRSEAVESEVKGMLEGGTKWQELPEVEQTLLKALYDEKVASRRFFEQVESTANSFRRIAEELEELVKRAERTGDANDWISKPSAVNTVERMLHTISWGVANAGAEHALESAVRLDVAIREVAEAREAVGQA